MKLNVGTLDRALRVAVGVALLSLFFVAPKSPWGLIGVIPLVTAWAGYCPLYGACKWSTRGGN